MISKKGYLSSLNCMQFLGAIEIYLLTLIAQEKRSFDDKKVFF